MSATPRPPSPRVVLDDSNCIVIVVDRLDGETRMTVTDAANLIGQLRWAKEQQDRREHPELNWQEADEVTDDDLRAASAIYDRLVAEHELELRQDPTGVDCFERYESPADQA